MNLTNFVPLDIEDYCNVRKKNKCYQCCKYGGDDFKKYWHRVNRIGTVPAPFGLQLMAQMMPQAMNKHPAMMPSAYIHLNGWSLNTMHPIFKYIINHTHTHTHCVYNRISTSLSDSPNIIAINPAKK